MYRLLIFSKSDCKIIDKISGDEVIKALMLFNVRNYESRFILYEYSSNADNEDEVFQVLYYFR